VAQPARLPDDPGGAWRESGAAFLFPRIAEECRSGRGELADQLPDLLYLRKDLPEQSILDMKQRILLYPEVESVTYMNRDEALREFRRSPVSVMPWIIWTATRCRRC
jgi:hypothetical protein